MSPEQRALLHKARRSVESARMSVKHGDYDFGASRAYYAMFYVAEALLLGKGLRFSSHSGVHAGFGEHFAKTGLIDTRFHRYLLDAADLRTQGDYRADFDIWGRTA